jgi:hypothetical protein
MLRLSLTLLPAQVCAEAGGASAASSEPDWLQALEKRAERQELGHQVAGYMEERKGADQKEGRHYKVNGERGV